MSRFGIQFRGQRPANYERVYAQVYKELTALYQDLDGRPEKLIFHTVFISKDLDGPSVLCWGDTSMPGIFQCEYSPKTEWTTINGTQASRRKRRQISHPRPPKGMV